MTGAKQKRLQEQLAELLPDCDVDGVAAIVDVAQRGPVIEALLEQPLAAVIVGVIAVIVLWELTLRRLIARRVR